MLLEFTCNGYYKDTKKETTYTLDIPADSDYPEYLKSLLEKGELNAAYTNNIINRTLRELFWFKDIIFVQVTQIAEKRNCVFMVMLDWLTPDDHDTDYYLFNDYEKALDIQPQARVNASIIAITIIMVLILFDLTFIVTPP